MRRPPPSTTQFLWGRIPQPIPLPIDKSISIWRPSPLSRPPPIYPPLTTHRKITDAQASLEMKRMSQSHQNKTDPPPPSNRDNTKAKKFILLLAVSAFTSTIWYKETNSASNDPRNFVPCTIVGKETVSSSSAIFTLRPEKEFARNVEGGVWSVEFKQPELQIAREYTPLPPLDHNDENDGDLRFLIRKEYGGEVSTYLHKLPIGATIEIRGPKIKGEIMRREGGEGSIDEVVFLAGGTGIAPALQIAYDLFYDARFPGEKPRMHILWANRRREDCVGGISTVENGVVKERERGWFSRLLWADPSAPFPSPPPLLDTSTTTTTPNPIITFLTTLQKTHPSHFSVTYKVDEENNFIQPKELKALFASKPPAPEETEHARKPGKSNKVVLICGPPGFMQALLGTKNASKGALSNFALRENGWRTVSLGEFAVEDGESP